MPVSTLTQFKSATRLEAKGLRMGRFRDVRGSNIQLIDTRLGAYDRVRHGSNKGLQTQALTALLAECARWLKTKKDKTNGTVQPRRAAILQLANDVFTELRTMQRADAIDYVNLNKAIATGTRANYGTKALSGTYAQERNVYVSGGKAQHPPSASIVHGFHQGQELSRKFNTPQNQDLMSRDWGHLTQADFESLSVLAAGMNQGERVHFANKEARAANLMVIYQGYNTDFENMQGQAFDTQADENGFMYAMDEYGTLFASAAKGLSTKGEVWNHSSFNAGKDVICAGMITIHKGVLQHVDNNSGHYKPTRQNLHTMMAIVANEGISLAGVTVTVREAAPGNMIAKHTLNAAQFVTNISMVDPNRTLSPAS